MKPNLIIAGDEIRAGIDMDDVQETGPIKNAIVITFHSAEEMGQALVSGSVEFDVMRRAEPTTQEVV